MVNGKSCSIWPNVCRYLASSTQLGSRSGCLDIGHEGNGEKVEFNCRTIDRIVFLFCTFITIFYPIIISNCATIRNVADSISD